MTTVRDLLREGKHRLKDIDTAQLEAEMLLARAMKVSRAYLFAHPENETPPDDAEQFMAAIRQRQAGQPMAYITGEREFWSLSLKVTPDVLIPRPETEVLVESALARIPTDGPKRIADIGTGSGAIAIALAHERPLCEVHATDISSAALDVAQANAKNLGLSNIHFHLGSWLEPLSGHFDLVVSNPPYLAADDPHLKQGDLPFEPDSALVSGPDGLEAIRILSNSAHEVLKPGGWMGLEHGHDQADACGTIMRAAGLTSINHLKDLAQITRVTWGLLA